MQSRWFHRPTLHSPMDGDERKVGWLELFYDLIYVATIIQLGNALSSHVSVYGFLAFAGMFVPLWFTWTGFTFYSNRFVVDDFTHRLTVFAQMFGIGAVAVSVGDVFEGKTQAFAISYAFVRAVHISFYARAWWQVDKAREMNRRYVIGFALGFVFWLASAFAAAPWVYLLWIAAMLIDLSTTLGHKARALTARYPPDAIHMSERYGLLTIIVLGESFVKVLTEASARPDHSAGVLLMCALGLAISCCLWWIYFDDVAGSRIKRKPLAPYVWVYAHLPLTIAITGIGVAIKKAVIIPDVWAPAGDAYRWLLCGTLGLTLFAVGIVDAVTERRQAELSDRQRVNVRIASAFFVLLLAPSGQLLPAWAFVGLIALCCVAQVLFDMSMAPIFADPHAQHHDHREVFMAPATRGRHAREPGDGTAGPGAGPPDGAAGAPARPRRLSLDDAIRRGVPNELRRDLYVHFMEGSWTRIFATFALLFLFINVVFAALYLLEPGSVSEVHDGSFLDAFAFSVQTMSTIGYGAMAPQSTYAHVLVTVEALLSIVGVALATGLVFAKASRPRASVLFSRVMVVHERAGVPTLCFRVGNARGNDLVEATIRVVCLRDEVTAEGHQLRRLHDLQLVRSRTPLFALTWSVFHPIDESSPLRDVTPTNAADELVSLVVTMTGHDSTFAQTTHARHIYSPEDIRWGHQFADVISNLPDGRLVLDFEHFHDTIPISTPGESDARGRAGDPGDLAGRADDADRVDQTDEEKNN